MTRVALQGPSVTGPHPLLSIIILARNDDFHGDYRWRVSTCPNFLARGLTTLGRQGDVEIIVCDWGSEIPLHKELVLHPAARELVRFPARPPPAGPVLARPRELRLRHRLQRRGAPLPWRVHRRVDRRRPTHHRRVCTPCWPCSGEHFPRCVAARPLCPSCAASCPVPGRRQPSLRELEEYLQPNLALLPADMMGVGYGWLCGAVMHRSLWHASRGYDETMLHWGWADVDLAFPPDAALPDPRVGELRRLRRTPAALLPGQSERPQRPPPREPALGYAHF